ncbi:MAG: hypothetical protein IJ773_03850 [Lachnospiraceae bacterium]|nr:hypothetical protein [Oscillospiraceae bacterium]MBR1812935.1 hypothetical protein [Lachnospiraceae bacterium]
MTMVTQKAIQQGFEKMQKLPHDKLKLLLSIIDQFSSDTSTASTVTLGLAEGKYHIPEDFNQYDDEIAAMFEAKP